MADPAASRRAEDRCLAAIGKGMIAMAGTGEDGTQLLGGAG
jgi:hypothetical protein